MTGTTTAESGNESPATGLPVAAGLAALAGLRSALPLALLSVRLGRATTPPAGPLALLARPAVYRTLVVAAAGELVADKLPFIPARTAPLPLAGRMGAGALVAVAATAFSRAARSNGRQRPWSTRGWWLPALAGAAAALVGTVAGYRFRAAGARLGLPDLPLALAEDALGLLAARHLLARLP